jgi:predicted nucleic acid-binding protein
VKNGITFDTGALIALERRGPRARKVLERATEQKVRITVPAATSGNASSLRFG